MKIGIKEKKSNLKEGGKRGGRGTFKEEERENA